MRGGGHRLPAGRPPNENTQGRAQALEGAAGRRRAPLEVGVPQGHKEKCARPEPRAGTLLTRATVHLPRLLPKPREGRGEAGAETSPSAGFRPAGEAGFKQTQKETVTN